MNPFRNEHKQISIFITAGYPQIDSLPQQLLFLQEQGIDFIEIGIPFSDPMADGPMIQHTSSIALQNGMHVALLFKQLASVREQLDLPLVLMGYLNPVLQFGLELFLHNCRELHVASLILPDLSAELYAAKYKEIFDQYGVPITFLITPATPDERVSHIARVCENSFVYLVGCNSITGHGYAIDESLQLRYRALKTLCGTTPLFLGFGIDSRAKTEQGFRECDGVIIGSAYLEALAAGNERDFIGNITVAV